MAAMGWARRLWLEHSGQGKEAYQKNGEREREREEREREESVIELELEEGREQVGFHNGAK